MPACLAPLRPLCCSRGRLYAWLMPQDPCSAPQHMPIAGAMHAADDTAAEPAAGTKASASASPAYRLPCRASKCASAVLLSDNSGAPVSPLCAVQFHDARGVRCSLNVVHMSLSNFRATVVTAPTDGVSPAALLTVGGSKGCQVRMLLPPWCFPTLQVMHPAALNVPTRRAVLVQRPVWLLSAGAGASVPPRARPARRIRHRSP